MEQLDNVYSLSSPLNEFQKSSFLEIGFLGLVVDLTVLNVGLDSKYEKGS